MLPNGTFLEVIRLTSRRPLLEVRLETSQSTTKRSKRWKYRITKTTMFSRSTKKVGKSQKINISEVAAMVNPTNRWEFESAGKPTLNIMFIPQPLASMVVTNEHQSLAVAHKLTVDPHYCSSCDPERRIPFWRAARYKKHMKLKKHRRNVLQNGEPDSTTEVEGEFESEFEPAASSSDDDAKQSWWLCGRCTFQNPNKENACMMCASSNYSDRWLCDACSTENGLGDDRCRVCRLPGQGDFASHLRKEAMASLKGGELLIDAAVIGLLEFILKDYPYCCFVQPNLISEMFRNLGPDENVSRKQSIIHMMDSIQDLEDMKQIVFPICVDDGIHLAHWCAVVAYVEDRRIFHIDSKFRVCKIATSFVKSLKAAMRMKFPTNNRKEPWRQSNVLSNEQSNEIDCGVFLVDNVLSVASSRDFKDGITQKDVPAKRVEYSQTLEGQAVVNPFRMR